MKYVRGSSFLRESLEWRSVITVACRVSEIAVGVKGPQANEIRNRNLRRERMASRQCADVNTLHESLK